MVDIAAAVTVQVPRDCLRGAGVGGAQEEGGDYSEVAWGGLVFEASLRRISSDTLLSAGHAEAGT